MFRGFYTTKFLDDFATTNSCFMNGYKIYIYRSNIRLYHCTAWENNLQHLYIPTRNWYINCDNRTYHCIARKNIICNICVFPTRNWYIYWLILQDVIYIMGKDNLQHLHLYLQETDTFIGMRMFPTVHHREFPYKRHLHYYVGIFYQFLHTNQYFLNTTLILSHTTHTHTQTHTHTHTHTHITEGSIFISELLPLKVGVWLSE